jgi:hypothetical protein
MRAALASAPNVSFHAHLHNSLPGLAKEIRITGFGQQVHQR